MKLIKKYYTKNNLVHVLLILFLFSLFFPIRHVFETLSAYQTGAYSDFTSYQIYLSDLFIMLIFVVLLLLKTPLNKPKNVTIPLLIWIAINLLYHWTTNIGLNYYFALKFAELILVSIIIAPLINQYNLRDKFIQYFTIFGLFESIIAILQFKLQHSIGLYKIGESVINPNLYGVAKFVSHGTKLIRGYGTFPHSNLLATFLVASILFQIYLLCSTRNIKTKIFYYFSLFIQIFALFITFSRGNLLILILAIISLTIIASFLKLQDLKSSLLIIIVMVIVSCITLWPYLSSRVTFSDSSVKERWFYDKIGLNMIKNNEIMGTGVGSSVLHMKQFSPVPLDTWEAQPIHNYYLITVAEFGIPGLLIILIIFLQTIKNGLNKIKNGLEINQKINTIILLTIFLSFLLLMLFDHYFYTLQQTQLLLWLIVGLVMSNSNKPMNYKTDQLNSGRPF